MMRMTRKRWWWAVAAGLIVGAMLGHAIGIYIRSDNLPFFDALGMIVGLTIGLTLFLWRSTRSS